MEATYAVKFGKSYLKCKGCWLHPGLCICGRLRRVESPAMQVAVFMHHAEWRASRRARRARCRRSPRPRPALVRRRGRGCNTGCLLRAALGADVYVSGMTESEGALQAQLASGRPAVVLWPGADSVTVADLPALFGAEAVASQGVLAVAIDATWNCAKKMVKRLPPSVPRLSLSSDAFPPGKSLLYPVRKYDSAGFENDNRVCTYEARSPRPAAPRRLWRGAQAAVATTPPQAVMGLAEELGAVTPQQREWLLWNLRMKVDAVLMHKNKPAAYGTLVRGPRGSALPVPLDEARTGLGAPRVGPPSEADGDDDGAEGGEEGGDDEEVEGER